MSYSGRMSTVIDARERFHVPSFTLADRLVKARADAGLSQERMGELLGCSRRTIVRYESKGRVPRSVVLAYHVATHTDLGWLETGKLPDWCTPRDLNPEPTDSGSGGPVDRGRVRAVVIPLAAARSRRLAPVGRIA